MFSLQVVHCSALSTWRLALALLIRYNVNMLQYYTHVLWIVRLCALLSLQAPSILWFVFAWRDELMSKTSLCPFGMINQCLVLQVCSQLLSHHGCNIAFPVLRLKARHVNNQPEPGEVLQCVCTERRIQVRECSGDPYRHEVHHRPSCSNFAVDRAVQRSGDDHELPVQRASHHQLPV